MPIRRWTIALALGFTARANAQLSAASRHSPVPSAENQPPVHEAWAQRDLLPGAQIGMAVQSADGYLWLATTKGLLRFDGERALRMDPPAMDSLPSPWVLALTTSRDGALWAGTARGGVFRLFHGTYTRWTTAQGLPTDQVNAIYQDPAGTVWIGTQAGLCRIDGSRCTRVGQRGIPALALGADWDGRLLVGSYGLFRLAGDSLVTIPQLTPSLFRINRIVRDSSGAVWLATVAGLVRLSPPTAPGAPPQARIFTTADGLPSNYVLSVLTGPGDELWVGTVGGGIALRRNGHFMVLDERQGLTDDRVNDLLRDREGDVWASTSGGLDRFHDRAVTTYTRTDGLPDPLVWGVAGDAAGNIWLTTNAGGLTRFDGRAFTTWRDHPAIATSRISVIAPVADGSVWLGVRPGMVVRFHDGRVDDWSHAPNAPTGNVVAILQAADGGLYFGGPGGLYRLDGGRFAAIALPGDSAARAIRVLAQSTDGTLWAAGNSLYRLRNGRVSLEGAAGAFTSQPITALLPDSGRLWLSTQGAGLRLLRNGRLISLANASASMLNDAFTMLDDGEGGIWLASSFGLQRVEKRALLDAADGRAGPIFVRTIDKTDGLLSTEFNSAGASSGWRSPDGRLWLPGADGLVEVDPRALRAPTSPPPVRVESVLADGRALPLGGPITLPHGTRQIEIDFTSLRFRSSRQLRFRYRLLGLDTAWVDAGTRRSAFYSSLPGGTYDFQLSAQDDGGVWNPVPATVSLRVIPPFRQTPWFFVLLGVATLGVTAGVVFLRGRALREHARVLEAQVAARTADLEHQVEIRERAEHALREARDNLEHRVVERTAALARANDELRLNQERLGLLVRQLPAVVWSTDLRQRIVSSVGSGLSTIGLRPGELTGRTFGEIIDDPNVTAALEEAHDRAFQGESTQHHGSYRGRVFEWRVEPLHDDDGSIDGAIGLAFDVTEQAKLREEMLQTQKMDSIGRLAGGLAHDLNNILTAVLGYVELSKMAGSGADLQDNLDEIRFAAERAAALTRQLLTFARRQKTSVHPLDLSRTLADLDGLLRRLLAADVELLTVPGDDVPIVLADPNQIEQVIVNLAVNARDAMPDGGRLTIATGSCELAEPRGDMPAGRYAMLTVTDTGTGMSDAVKRRAFEPFFTTKEVGKGTGLGLATCFGIVREFGGFIEIDSALGAGTMVRVCLPAHDAAPWAEPARTVAGRGAPGTETVLLAEDEPQVREIARRALETFGYHVLVAADGDEALRVALAHRGPIHLLLADLRMPRMGGYELAAQLRGQRPGIRVMFMSGYSEFRAPVDDPALANAPRLTKPFRVGALAQSVRDALDTAPPIAT